MKMSDVLREVYHDERLFDWVYVWTCVGIRTGRYTPRRGIQKHLRKLERRGFLKSYREECGTLVYYRTAKKLKQ